MKVDPEEREQDEDGRRVGGCWGEDWESGECSRQCFVDGNGNQWF